MRLVWATKVVLAVICLVFLELYPNSVFWYGIGWYFLGIFLTDTKGMLNIDATRV